MDIPCVDLAALAGDDEKARAGAVRAIAEGFGTFGLVFVKNHPIARDNLEALYDQYLAFTQRSEAEKAKLRGTDIWYQRGWTPPNVEKAVVAGGQPDFKECYFAAPLPTDEASRAFYPEIHADNLWPEDLDGFAERYETLGRELHQAGEALLRGCAMALELSDGTFTDMIDGGPHVLRLLRYLPVTAEQLAAKVVWGEEHTDFNLLTLLPGGIFMDEGQARCPKPDPDAGLYLRTRPSEAQPRGEKVQGVAPPGCIVAQVGQQLEILTGGRFLATPHVIRAPSTPGYSRMAAAHFIHMNSLASLFPLEPFRTPATVDAYRPPRLAGTYALKTLVDIGLAPREAIDELGYRQYDRLALIRAEEDAAS